MSLDNETIQFALRKAHECGFRRVRIESEGVCFRALVGGSVEAGYEEEAIEESVVPKEQLPANDIVEVTSPLVGYYQGIESLIVGSKVHKGETIVHIMALGLVNDVNSEVDGIVTEILVVSSQPVEFGQVLMRIRAEQEAF